MYRTCSWFIVIAATLLTFLAPHPVVALAANGPRLIYSTFGNVGGNDLVNQLWVANADGSAPQVAVKDKVIVDFVANPTSGVVAFMTSELPPATSKYFRYIKLTLNVLTLPEMQTRVITPLTNDKTEPKNDDRNEVVEAITMRYPPSMQWSPDGQMLAFVGAQDGTSADLYVYSLATNQVTRLSTGNSQAISPSWSPDSKYIVHLGVDEFGTGAGRLMAGVWAAQADNSGIITLDVPLGGNAGVLGWTSPTSFLTWNWNVDCDNNHLLSYDILTHKQDMWFPGHFWDAAWSPDDQTLFVSAIEPHDPCGDLKQGLYIVTAAQRTPRKIADISPTELLWSPELGKLFAYEDQKILTVTPDGEVTDLKFDGLTEFPAVSPDVKRLAWTKKITDFRRTLMLSDSDGGNQTQVGDMDSVVQVIWAH